MISKKRRKFTAEYRSQIVLEVHPRKRGVPDRKAYGGTGGEQVQDQR